MNEIKTEVIQVRMKEHTLEQLDRLKTVVKSSSRSDAVRRSLDISDVFIDTIIKGGKVIIEDKKGKQQQILITGLNR